MNCEVYAKIEQKTEGETHTYLYARNLKTLNYTIIELINEKFAKTVDEPLKKELYALLIESQIRDRLLMESQGICTLKESRI